MDNKEVILLVLLDLSAACDTIERSILLNILQQDFGVVGTSLNWFDSFLSGRKQRILVGDKTSDDFMNCGSSQHLPSIYGYADDTKIYLSFQPCSVHSDINAVSVIEKCIADVHHWFIANRLMTIDRKTEFLIIGPPLTTEKTSIESITVGDTNTFLFAC